MGPMEGRAVGKGRGRSLGWLELFRSGGTLGSAQGGLQRTQRAGEPGGQTVQVGLGLRGGRMGP